MENYLSHSFDNIISIENLLLSWREFLKGKKKRKDVLEFQLHLMDNILDLHESLKNKTYIHSDYHAFKINDPKPRDIHKASVADRLVHHAIYKVIYPYFDKKFIFDSYSCRINKGTHKAIKRFDLFSGKVSKNYSTNCFVLKCDIKKFFANIDHDVLKDILRKFVKDADTIWLLFHIIDSFKSNENVCVGLPLGNLTSQLLVNIYMNEFDQFAKHKLKVKYYIRYADDFVFLSQDKIYLENLIKEVVIFLKEKLQLELHPSKVFIKTIYSGVDFLGWVNYSKYRILRTSTKQRIFRNLKNRQEPKSEILQSYIGLLSYGNTFKLQKKLFLIYNKKDF